MELQQFRVRAAWVSDREDQRRELREIRAGKYFHAAGNEGFGLRFELRDHRTPGFGLHAQHRRPKERRLYRYDDSTVGGSAVFHYGRSAAMGAGIVWREGFVGGIAGKNDHAVSTRLCV